ncbi:MAG TPA: class I SAM-dependent methyltransferase [Myxococcota bacterium]|nr:class I SAM-dependent methyltransferase [Myxococcota bacterium]
MRSVLFKGFPEPLNRHIDDWHRHIVLEQIDGGSGQKILDVGCGYGRLSEAILEVYPEAEITGLDVSRHFVELFRTRTGRPAVQGRLEDWPELPGRFHLLICVTVLMYVPDECLDLAVGNLVGSLHPGGRMILIESHGSGLPFLTACGLLRRRPMRGTRDLDTGGRYFLPGRIESLIAGAGARIVSRQRMSATSLAILPLALAAKLLPRRLSGRLLRSVGWLDSLLDSWRLPSLHVAYIIEKSPSGEPTPGRPGPCSGGRHRAG